MVINTRILGKMSLWAMREGRLGRAGRALSALLVGMLLRAVRGRRVACGGV
jgi:hypothetical protein